MNFDCDLLHLVKNIRFSRVSNTFHDRLRKTIAEIKTSPDIFVLSDKTGNIYTMAAEVCENLILKDLYTNYKHAHPNALDRINESHFGAVKSLGLVDRTRPYDPNSPHYLMKDHKPNFTSDPSIRLICPTKSNLAVISKGILDRIISALTLK